VSGFYCEGGANKSCLNQGLAECHELSHAHGRSLSFLKTKELSGWNIIEHL
jgi:hypothetical protein